MSNKVLLGIAWFTPEQWPEEQRVMIDKAGETYAQWLSHADDLEKKLKKEGIDFVRVPVDLDDFQIWSRRRGKKHDAASRAQYVAEKLRNR